MARNDTRKYARAIEHAKALNERGRLSPEELDDVIKKAARDHLESMPMEDYAKLSESGDLDRMLRDSEVEDHSRAERAVSHVIQDYITSAYQSGRISEKDAVEELAKTIDLPEGDSDSDRLMSHASLSVLPDYRPSERKAAPSLYEPAEINYMTDADPAVADFKDRNAPAESAE